MAQSNTLYKLMILYMLEKIDFSMTFSRISDFILGRGYTDYFTLQEAAAQLAEDELIHIETIRNSSYYTITPEGKETIDLLISKLSPQIRDDIREYLRENRFSMIDESAAVADYYRSSSGEYIAWCRIREKDAILLDVRLSVPDLSQAKAICVQWSSKSQEVYEYLIGKLMKGNSEIEDEE